MYNNILHSSKTVVFLDVQEIDLDTLMELLSRTQLDPSSELTVFNAASAWAKAVCKSENPFSLI